MEKNYPKISVITPSYNQGDYLEETIQSVLNQNYPNIEYIIIDGGSSDNSVEIIKKYQHQLSYWVSEKDRGQSHAINKGFERATGDIICWLNSDDLFTTGCLNEVAQSYNQEGWKWLTASCYLIDEKSNTTGSSIPELPNTIFEWLNLYVRGYSYTLIQPSTFWCKTVMEEVKKLDEKLHYSFDHEFFLRIFQIAGKPEVSPQYFSKFRLHAASKTVSSATTFTKENRIIGYRNINTIPSLKRRIYLLLNYIRYALKNRHSN